LVQSSATTVSAYLKELPPERRAVVSAARKVIRRHLPDGFQERIAYGLISYEVPLKRFPDTYNGQPLCYVGLAAQKNHYSLYLMCAYGDARKAAWLKEQFQKAGKKLDMGKSCIRFRSPEDLPLDAISEVIASCTPEQWIACYKASRTK
jgi:hypothetical protein